MIRTVAAIILAMSACGPAAAAPAEEGGSHHASRTTSSERAAWFRSAIEDILSGSDGGDGRLDGGGDGALKAIDEPRVR